MNVLFTTNFPSPYRVDFFNELGKYCNLTVAYERSRALHRDSKWVGNNAENFKEIFLNQRPIGTSQSIGFGIIKTILKNKFDRIILCGYASPSVILAVAFCRLFNIKYMLEFDGGFYKKDKFFLRNLKKFIFRGSDKLLITCHDTERYLKSFGITPEKISFYPFSSLWKSEILDEVVSDEEKQSLKNELGISEKKAIISVGQFLYGKGFDILIKAMQYVEDSEVGVYIVGGEVTEEYLKLCKSCRIDNIHFVSFCKKDELLKWYKACDLFVFPTRSDVWGLVVNEAMACGLPVISSNMCIAAKELLNNSETFIYNCEDYKELSCKINSVLKSDLKNFGTKSLDIIRDYTIENMALEHLNILQIPERD